MGSVLPRVISRILRNENIFTPLTGAVGPLQKIFRFQS